MTNMHNNASDSGFDKPALSRTVYIVIAIFLGGLGIHNFYAKRKGPAIAQLLMTVLTFGFLAPVSVIWAIVDICIVDEDGLGRPMQ